MTTAKTADGAEWYQALLKLADDLEEDDFVEAIVWRLLASLLPPPEGMTRDEEIELVDTEMRRFHREYHEAKDRAIQ